MNAPFYHYQGQRSGEPTMLVEALRHAREGKPVFPCNPETKKPLTENGFKNATTAAAQIQEWWTTWPLAFIGMPTGQASGIAVLDLDLDYDLHGNLIKDGKASLEAVVPGAVDGLPDTVLIGTPRGGKHYWFSHEEGFKSTNGIVDGVDLKAEGGYVILPPSKRPDGRCYHYLNPEALFDVAAAPEWLAERFRNGKFPKPENEGKKASGSSKTSSGSYSRSSGDSYFRRVNDEALARLDSWVQALFPEAVYQAGTGAWRVTSNSLNRNYQEDLSIHPKGISDWGPETTLTPINLVMEFGSAPGPLQAAEWLCERMGVDPASLGKRAQRPASEGSSTDANGLLLNGKGAPIANLANVLTVVRTAPEWSGVVGFDEMASKAILLASIPGSAEASKAFKPRPLADADVLTALEWFQHHGFPSIGKEVVSDGLVAAAQELSFDPLANKLRSLRWDGVARIHSWLLDYCGAEVNDTQHETYVRAVGRCWLISAAARALQPGCKVDSALVLVGPQGIGKSTAGRILAYDWFSDSLPPVHSKDAADHLRGVWIVEFGEMATASRSDVEELKAFITRTVERFRPAYGRLEIEYPRRNVFFGTSNRDAFLKDETGNRRFWPVVVSSVDAKRLEQDRDQLWAEAVHSFEKGVQWHLTEDEASLAFKQQAAFVVLDERADLLKRKLHGYRVTTTLKCLDLLEMKNERREQMEVSGMLRSLGWRRCSDGSRRYWESPDNLNAEGCQQDAKGCQDDADQF